VFVCCDYSGLIDACLIPATFQHYQMVNFFTTSVPTVCFVILLLTSQAKVCAYIFSGHQSGDWFYELVPEYGIDPDATVREATIIGYTGEGGDVVIPSSIDGFPVTQIGIGIRGDVGSGPPIFYDFDPNLPGEVKNNTSVVTVIIPDSVRIILSGALSQCDGLTKVTIGNGTTAIQQNAFAASINLSEVHFGRNVRTIMRSAFEGCTSLNNVMLPDSLQTIDQRAFFYCTGLTNISLGASVTSIRAFAFWNSGLSHIDIPDSVLSIGQYAFAFNTNLKEAKFGDGVLNLPDHLFVGCTQLESVILPNQLLVIGEHAFDGCSSLTWVGYRWRPNRLSLPNSVISLGDSAFAGCSSLPHLAIPEGLTTIPSNAFSGCSSLTRLGVYSPSIGSASNIMPKSLTSIGDSAFSGTALQTVNIPVTTYISPNALSSAIQTGNIVQRQKTLSPTRVQVDSDTILTKEDFLSALATNEFFLEALANKIISSTDDNYGIATKSDLGIAVYNATTQAIAQVRAAPNSYDLYSPEQYLANYSTGVAAGTSLVTANPDNYSLYTSNSIMDLRMGGLMIQKIGDNAIVSFQPQTTTDLTLPFTNNGIPVTYEISMPGSKGFLRLNAKPEQSLP